MCPDSRMCPLSVHPCSGGGSVRAAIVWSWTRTLSKVISFLDLKAKKQETLCFSKGAIFQCTFNQDGSFSQSQLALCYDVPDQEVIDNFRRIKLLVFPPTIKYDTFQFDSNLTKDDYIGLGFKEVFISQAPETIRRRNQMSSPPVWFTSLRDWDDSQCNG